MGLLFKAEVRHQVQDLANDKGKPPFADHFAKDWVFECFPYLFDSLGY
jgi:hypothetical protein